MNSASPILIAGGIIVACVLLLKLCFRLGKAELAEKERKERLTLQLHPTYRQKLAEDRQYELAKRAQAFQETKWQAEFEHKRHLERTRVSPEIYLINEAPTCITALPSLKRAEERTVVQEEQPDHALPPLVKFADIVETLGNGQFCLGNSVNGLETGTITDLLSTGIAGRPGTGKSTLLRFICAQVLRSRGVASILDPHGSIADDLGNILECAVSTAEIEQTGRQLERVLNLRIDEYRQGRRRWQPVLVLADEWPIIATLCPQVVQLIRRIVLEGRKVYLYALISGQGLPASLFSGGTLVRDALSSRYVFNTTPAQARLAGIENETAKELLACIETAGPGYAILATARRNPQIVTVPNTTVAAIQSCLVETPVSVVETASQANEDTPVNVSEQTGLVRETSPLVGPETRTIIKRMRAKGKPHREIADCVGLSGRNYVVYQMVCKEEGLEA